MMALLRACSGEASALRALAVLILVTAVARLLLASTIGLGIDEAYTVATSRTLTLSTYDHPPMAWWLAGAAQRMFGSSEPLVVRLPFIALSLLSAYFAFNAGRFLYSARAGFFAALALTFAPVLGWTGGTMVLPDGPLIAALLGGLCCLSRALFGDAASAHRWWLAAGVAAGLACLSKLHGVFLFAGTGLFLLTAPTHRHWLRSPWPYLAALLALLIFSPVLIWNAQHHWISFAFQAGRAKATRFDLWGPFVALGGQALFLLPWVWGALIISLFRAARTAPRQPRDWLLFCLAIGPIAAFTLVALNGTKTLFHWAAPGYLFACILLGRDLARDWADRDRAALWWLRGSTVALAVLYGSVLALARLPWPALNFAHGKPVPYPLIETQSWGEVREALAARGFLARPGTFAAGLKWHETARIDLAAAGKMPVLCLCMEPHHFGIVTANRDFLGQDAIIVSSGLTLAEAQARLGAYFQSLTPVDSVPIVHAGQVTQVLQIYLGKGFRDPGLPPPNILEPFFTAQKPTP